MSYTVSWYPRAPHARGFRAIRDCQTRLNLARRCCGVVGGGCLWALLEEEPEPPIKRFHCDVQNLLAVLIEVLFLETRNKIEPQRADAESKESRTKSIFEAALQVELLADVVVGAVVSRQKSRGVVGSKLGTAKPCLSKDASEPHGVTC